MVDSKAPPSDPSDPFFMPDQNPFFLRTRPAAEPNSRHVEDATDIALRIAPRDAEERTWTGSGTTVPVFWASLFASSEIQQNGAATSIELGVEKLSLRHASWKAKSSPTIFRGYESFSKHLKELGSGVITLDLSSAGWRRPAFAAAVTDFLEFLDGAKTEPGPLLSGWKGWVVWKKMKGRLRLEAADRHGHWPDEVLLLAPHGDVSHLLEPTMGNPPFRRGPWPERRFTVDGYLTSLPEDAALRAVEVKRAIDLHWAASSDTKGMARAGNLEAVEQTRKLWEDFLEAAEPLADTAAAFAARHQVYDDTALWREMLEDVDPGLAELDRWAATIEAAMRELER
jgi:hypothetical protein